MGPTSGTDQDCSSMRRNPTDCNATDGCTYVEGLTGTGKEVLTHELGHGYGLGHSTTPGSVMFQSSPKRDGKLGPSDVTTIRALYNVTGNGDQASDLDQP